MAAGNWGRGEDGGSLGREAEPVRAQQPGLGWAEAGRAVGTALFPLPRPLGPPPLPPALHRPRSGRRPLVRHPEAVPSGPFLLGRGEAVSLPLPRAPSQRAALLGGKGRLGFRGFPARAGSSLKGKLFSPGSSAFCYTCFTSRLP